MAKNFKELRGGMSAAAKAASAAERSRLGKKCRFSNCGKRAS